MHVVLFNIAFWSISCAVTDGNKKMEPNFCAIFGGNEFAYIIKNLTI